MMRLQSTDRAACRRAISGGKFDDRRPKRQSEGERDDGGKQALPDREGSDCFLPEEVRYVRTDTATLNRTFKKRRGVKTRKHKWVLPPPYYAATA